MFPYFVHRNLNVQESSQGPLKPFQYQKTAARDLWSLYGTQKLQSQASGANSTPKFQPRDSGASPVLKKSSHRPLEPVQYPKSSSQKPLEHVWNPKTPVRGLPRQSSAQKLKRGLCEACPIPNNSSQDPLEAVQYPRTPARGLWSLSSTQKLQPQASGASLVFKTSSQRLLSWSGTQNLQPQALEPFWYPKVSARDLCSLSSTQKLQSGASGASLVPKNSSQRPLEPVQYPKTLIRGLWGQSGTQKLKPGVCEACLVPKNSSQRSLGPVQYPKIPARSLWRLMENVWQAEISVKVCPPDLDQSLVVGSSLFEWVPQNYIKVLLQVAPSKFKSCQRQLLELSPANSSSSPIKSCCRQLPR